MASIVFRDRFRERLTRGSNTLKRINHPRKTDFGKAINISARVISPSLQFRTIYVPLKYISDVPICDYGETSSIAYFSRCLESITLSDDTFAARGFIFRCKSRGTRLSSSLEDISS